VQGVLVDLFCAGGLGVIAWVMWTKAGQMLEYGDKTQQLGLTLGWFVYLMSALLFINALIHLILMLTPVAHHHIGVDEGATS
jgi:hypothetical protein